MTGLPDGRMFFDETRGTVIPPPALSGLLDQAPFLVNRFRQDATGTIWATHDDGLLSISVQDGQPVFDTTFGKINDRFPLAHLLPGGDIWLVTGQSLYHLNRDFEAVPRPALNPTLVSLTSGRTNRELLPRPGVPDAPPLLPYEDNSLVFRFFAGSYATRQPPAYEFRLHQGNDSRLVLGNGSLLTLTDLREGSYRLEVRLSDTRKPVGQPLSVGFTINPPWYRGWLAYALYLLAGTGAILGLMHWSARRSQAKNITLEKLVAERTDELRHAMQQLNEETRNAATLAERGRLAGEIHDSLQQGLSGLMLQLDATLRLADLPEDVRARLIVARNMVSFTRHEVQHAVWDMETPLLEGTELGEALKKITGLIGPGPAEVRIDITGPQADLASATKHHLLRIAQEAITNAVRHAAARHITITLAHEPDAVRLAVSDDGNGFVPGDIFTHSIGHFGLRGLRARAAKIGGDLDIRSAPGQGTVVQVRVRTLQPVL
jgi:signal transduction histidine kinase